MMHGQPIIKISGDNLSFYISSSWLRTYHSVGCTE